MDRPIVHGFEKRTISTIAPEEEESRMKDDAAIQNFLVTELDRYYTTPTAQDEFMRTYLIDQMFRQAQNDDAKPPVHWTNIPNHPVQDTIQYAPFLRGKPSSGIATIQTEYPTLPDPSIAIPNSIVP